MKKMMRRIAALLLCMLMILGCGSAVFAASEKVTAAEALKEILEIEDESNIEVNEIADLYTGSDLALLEERLQEWQQSGIKPDAPNLSLVCDTNVGKVVTIRYYKQYTLTYYMLRNKDGVWCLIGEDGDLSKKFSRYTTYTGVKHPAMYCNSGYVEQYKRDLSEWYLFDDTAEECFVMRLGRDKFYRSEEMIDNWYTYWTHSNREYGYRYPNSGVVCLDSFGIYSGLKEYHPRVWLSVLIWGGIIGGILLLVGLVIWLLRRSKESSASWVEKIPLTWRMLTGATRYIK